jgi:hypothetical protein
MKLPVRALAPRLPGKPAKITHGPGVYLGCSVCGRLLKIAWATRSIVCSCGARINPTPEDAPEGKQG